MKVLLVNGSPHKNGCTNAALGIVAEALQKEGIETEIFWIGNKPMASCLGCATCMKKQQCVFDDAVNRFAEVAKTADGFVFGSPVHYAGIAGAMNGFLDRAFMSDELSGRHSLLRKPGAVVTTSRRAGATATLDQMQKWLSYSEMPIVSSRYWNEIHGNTPEEIQQDTEGIQILSILGRNMAWILKSIEAGRQAGVPQPETEQKIFMNFNR